MPPAAAPVRKYLFADEAGDLDFLPTNSSRYFILSTITIEDCSIGDGLMALRRDMIWRGLPVETYFHATTDRQVVRDEVFDFIQSHAAKIRVDATVMEKRKAQPHLRPTKHRFYQYAWHYHLKFVAPQILRASTDELLITAASIGTKKGQAVFTASVNDVAQQALRIPRSGWRTCFTQAMADPCLQIADYCTWAVQRKWEGGDERSWRLIQPIIQSEFDLFRTGQHFYY